MSETANLVINVDSASAKTAYADVTNLMGGLQRLEQSTENVGKKFVQIGEIIGRQNTQMLQEIRVTNDMTDAGQRLARSMQFKVDMVEKAVMQDGRANAIAAQFSRGEINKANAIADALEKMKIQASVHTVLNKSQDDSIAKGNEFIANLKRQADTIGMSEKEIRAYEAAQLGVSQQAAPLIEKISQASTHVEGFSLKTAGAKRELIAFASEMLQGNWDKFGSSMLSLAEATGASATVLGALSAPVIVAGTAVAALGVAFYQGARESIEFNRQMTLTGEFAGITKGQFDEMAASIANSTGSGIGNVKETLLAFASSGKFTSDTIDIVTQTAVDWARASKQSTAEVVNDFSKMTDGVAQWAFEHNKQYSFLTVAEYAQVAALEEHGKKNEAIKIVMEAYDGRAKQTIATLGGLEHAWTAVTSAMNSFWNKLSGVNSDTTAEDKIRHTKRHVDFLKDQIAKEADNGNSGSPRSAQLTKALSAAQSKLDTETETQRIQKRATQLKSEEDQRTQAGIIALKEQKKLADALNIRNSLEKKAVNDYLDGQEKLRLTDIKSVDSKELATEKLLAIHKKYQKEVSGIDPAGKALARQLDNDQAEVEAFKRHNAALQKLDDLRHQNGDIADKEYLANKNALILADEKKEIEGYEQQLKHLSDFHGKGTAAIEENLKKQNDIKNKLQLANQKYADDTKLFEEQAMYAERAKTEEALGISDKQIAAIKNQIDIEKKKLDQMGVSQKAVEESARNKLIDAAATDEQSASAIRAIMSETDYGSELDNMAKKLEESAALKRTLLQIKDDQVTKKKSIDSDIDAEKKVKKNDTDVNKQLEDLNDFLDPKKAKSFSEVLKDGFGEAGVELSKLAKAFEDYSAKQEELDKKRRENTKYFEEGRISKAKADENEAQLNQRSVQESLDGYAKMSGAAKSFFAEGSNGYKAMHAAESIFRAASLAMTIADMAKKLFAVTAVTTATVTGEATKDAAVVAGVGTQLAADAVKGASAAGVAVATQASGDPYTAWARMAVMAATMAALGFAVGGFGGGGDGGGKTAAEVQKTQGTGSVFGDPNAKSDSIGKSLEILKNNSNLMLPVNQSMLTALKNIQASLSGLANLVIRTPGVADGGNMNIVTGQINKGEPTDIFSSIGSTLLKIALPGIGGPIASFLNNLWGKTTQNIVDSGIQFGGSLSALQKGQGYNQYASVNTTTSSFFGLVKNTSNSVQTQALNSELSSQLGLIFSNLEDALKSASKGLGVSAKSVEETLSQLQISTTTVSLKGLSGTALTEALNAVISKTMDGIAFAALPGLEGFRQIGEGYAQTVIRVASNVELAGNELEKLGITAINFKDIIYKQGDVGAEIVRQSIENVETVLGSALSGVGKIIADMSGSAADLAKAYKELVDIRKQMGSVGMNGSNLNVSLIKGSGGTSELSSGLNNYLTNYFSEAEQTAAKTKILTDQFAALGITMPKNREAFRQLINDTGTSTDAASLLTGKLLMLADAFNTVMSATDKVSTDNASRAKDLANKQSDMQMQLMELQGRSSEVLQLRRKAELAAMDESLRPLQERIYALQDEKTATDAALTTAKQHRALDIELMTATGDTEGALAAKRADALVGMDDYSKGIQKQIWAAEDAKAALEKAQQSAAKAQQEQEAARQAAQQAAQQAQQEAQRIQLEAQQAYEQRLSTAKTALQNAYNAEASAMQNVISKMQGFATAARAMQQTLYSAANSPITVPEQYVNARADLPGVIADAKSGNQDSIAKLQQFVNLSQQSATDFNDYRRDFALVQNTLDESASEAERQVKQNQTQLDLMKNQVDGLLNVNISVLSVNDAIKALQDVMAGGLNGVATALNGQYKANNATTGTTTTTAPTPDQIYGGFPGEGENQLKKALALQEEAANTAKVRAYRDQLVQADLQLAERGGKTNDFYMGMNDKYYTMAGFQTIARQLGIFANPDLPTASQLPRFASGGYHLGGLRIVGESGPELEVTGPSRIFSASQTASMLRGNSGSEDLVNEIQMLRAEVRAVASNTAGTNKTLDRWTNVGMPATEVA